MVIWSPKRVSAIGFSHIRERQRAPDVIDLNMHGSYARMSFGQIVALKY